MENLLIKKPKSTPSPTLNTILMVEDVIKDAEESVISVSFIKKNLSKQVNHYTLIKILEYLEESNKIAVSIKGITWINNNNRNLRKELDEGLEL